MEVRLDCGYEKMCSYLADALYVGHLEGCVVGYLELMGYGILSLDVCKVW